MLILGIDPGTATTGYGLVESDGNGTTKVITWGLIETDKNGFKEKRLEVIYKEILALIKTHSPDLFVMEKVFFATNAKTAIAVRKILGSHVKSKAHKKTHFDNAADALAVALTHAFSVNKF